MAQKYLEERRGGTARQVHKGDKGTLTSSGRQCLGIVFVEVDSSILEYGERERERVCMRWPERTGACLPLIGTLGKYVGLIGHDMQTSALKKRGT